MTIDLFRGVVPFVAVAEELSFHRAAIRLGVTRAAVSKAVQALEAELGVRLLERTSRTVSLTREGAMFFQRCKDAVDAVTVARSDTADARRAPQGEAVVSAPFLVARPVVSAVALLKRRHPRLTVRLHITDALAKVGAGVDVAVRIGGSDETLAARTLRDTRWVTVAAPAYLARNPAPLRTDELFAHDCLVFLAPNGRPRSWSFAAGDVDVSAAFIVDHGPSLLDAARDGMGIAQVLDFMVEEDVKAGRVVEVLARDATIGPSVRALSVAGRRSPNVKAILDALTSAFAL